MSEVVAPVLKMKNCVFIALSTNLGKDNHFSKLFDEEDKRNADIKDVCFRLQIDLMCDDCRRAGKQPHECNDKDYLNPEWNIGANKGRIKAFMPDDDMYAREVLGTLTSDHSCIFNDASLKRFKHRIEADRYTFEGKDTTGLCVFTLIDPTGGSVKNTSETAIVSIVVLPDNTIVIVGLASMNTIDKTQVKEFIGGYFRTFREHMGPLSGCQHIVMCERNHGGTHQADLWVNEYARGQLEHITEYRSHEGVSGVWTDETHKKNAAKNLVWDFHRDRVLVADTLCVTDLTKVDALLEKFQSQIGNVREVVKGNKIVITGKKPGSASDPASADDMAIAFVLVRHWAMEIFLRGLCDQEEIRARNMAAALRRGEEDSYYSEPGLGGSGSGSYGDFAMAAASYRFGGPEGALGSTTLGGVLRG